MTQRGAELKSGCKFPPSIGGMRVSGWEGRTHRGAHSQHWVKGWWCPPPRGLWRGHCRLQGAQCANGDFRHGGEAFWCLEPSPCLQMRSVCRES